MRGRGEIFWGGDVAVVYIAPPPPPLSSSPNEKGEKEGRKKEEGCSFDFWWNSLELRRRRRAFPAERGGEMKRRGAEPYSTMRPLIREKPRTRGPRSIQSRKEEKWGAGGEKELSFLLPSFVCAKGPPFSPPHFGRRRPEHRQRRRIPRARKRGREKSQGAITFQSGKEEKRFPCSTHSLPPLQRSSSRVWLLCVHPLIGVRKTQTPLPLSAIPD